MKSVPRGLIALLTLAISLPAAAADRSVPPVAIPPTPEQRELISAIARCLVEHHRTEAADFVLHRTVWMPSRRSSRDCVPPKSARRNVDALLKKQRDTLLFEVAGNLVRKEFQAFDHAVIGMAQFLPSSGLVDTLWPPEACKECKPEQIKKVEEARARVEKIMAPHIFGECVVRTDTANAHRVIMAAPDSPQEDSAIQSIAPALNHCVTEGSQLKVARSLMRGILAVSYYRLAHAPRAQQVRAQD